jgi:hypothetical protein
MKHLIISLLPAGSFIALSTMEASAVVCARGVVRAGCVAAGGAAVATGGPPSWRGGPSFVLLPELLSRREESPSAAGRTDNFRLKTCRANNARQSVCGRTRSNAYSGFELAAD